MIHRKTPILAALGLCLAASACVPYAGHDETSLEDSVPRDRSKMVALAGEPAVARGSLRMPAMVALPPEAGAVAKVRTRVYANGLRQDIILKAASSGRYENALVVMARTDRRQTLDEQVPLYKPTEAGIRSEIGAHYPGVSMRVADRESSNAYGPYGLALGRTGADLRCVYMWQWIDANRLPPDAGFAGPATVRVRLCQAGASFDAMAALLDHLTIGADGTRFDTAMNLAPADAHDERPAKKPRRPARHGLAEASPSEGKLADAHGSVYMAPLVPSSAKAAQPSPSLTAGLSRDLPAQAYLGPKAAPIMKAAAQPGAY